MQTVRWWRGAAVAAGLLALILGGAARGAEDKPNKDLDKAIYKSLANVVNRGADAYNNGDHMGCYRLYEGALLAVQPLLAHRPKLQGDITKGLAGAAANPVLLGKTGRAWALHDLLENVRKRVNPDGTGKPDKPPVVDKPKTKTLWDRLGGEKGVKKIVDDLVTKAAKDKKVDFTRGGKYPLTGDAAKRFKKEAINWISSVSKGPYEYDGKSMKDAHKGMGITKDQFDAFKEDLQDVLFDNGVNAEDRAAIMTLVEEFRKAIVAPKKPPTETKEPKTTKPPTTKPPVTTKPATTKPPTTKPPKDTKDTKPPKETKSVETK